MIAPRTAIKDLCSRSEAKRTGVYLLLGDDPALPGRLALYIGEGDLVADRLNSHDVNKEFWDTAILFVSKDENLTKAHVRWLEARLIKLGRDAKRATVANLTDPDGGTLPEADQAEMSEFITQIRLVLGSLGYDVFAPAKIANNVAATPSASLPEFTLVGDGFRATCIVEEDRFVVRAGSEARVVEAPALQATYRNKRAELLAAGVLAAAGNVLKFSQDFAFTSPSAAAAVVSGTTINGRSAWKRPDGSTYSEWEKEREANVVANTATPSTIDF